MIVHRTFGQSHRLEHQFLNGLLSLLCLGTLSVSINTLLSVQNQGYAAPVFEGSTRLFEIEQEGRFKRSAPAVERTETAEDFYDFFSASSHTGFEVAKRSITFLYRDIRTDELGLFFTHGIDDLGQPADQRQPSADVMMRATNIPAGARIAEADDNCSEFNFINNDTNWQSGASLNAGCQGHNSFLIGDWSFGNNTDGGAIDSLPTDEDWAISIDIRFSGAMDEWAYFFADGTRLVLDPDLPLILRSKGGSVEADTVTSNEGQSVTFCALATDDAGQNLTYNFNWRDGSSNSISRVQGELACHDHSFPDNGTYDVLVTATNQQGQSTSKEIRAIISNVAPSVITGGPFIIDTQVPSTLEINLINDPGSADTHQARWDYDGDGTWDTNWRDGLTYQVVYERAGRYFAQVEVRDDDGAVDIGSMTIYAGVPPEVYSDETDPNIMIAGYSPTDPGVPYPVYRGAPITLKAILRNTVGCNNYQVIWDIDEDGQFEENGQDLVLNNLSPSNSSVYDVGIPYTVPNDAVEGRHLIGIKATNTCNGFIDYDVMRIYIYPWTPSGSPTQWSKEQLDVMTQVGIQEGLWYMHRKLGGRSGGGAQIQGYLNASSHRHQQSTAMAIWAFTINGRLPAYPPNSIDAQGHTLPVGWEEENLIRWRLDPYSETAARMVNYVTSQSGGRSGVNGSDEDNTCDIDGTQCSRLPSSYAGQGAYINGGSNYTYSHGLNTGALATVLPSLAGTPIQTGALKGQLWEGFVQDQVDYLGYLQIPSGCGKGGWYYSRTTNTGCIYMDASTAQWGYIGLESAEVAGFRYGVFVNNNHKYKAGWNIVRNQDGYGSSSYRTDYSWSNNNLTLTGGFFVIARWLGFQNFNSGDGAVPFPHSNYSKGQMRDALNRARNYTANKWMGSEGGSYHINRRFWSGGSYTCNNSNSTYKWGSGATCGNLYAIYSHQKGYRTTSKVYDRVNGEIQEGEQEPAINGHSWSREFATYILRSQERNTGDYNQFGRIDDCGGGSTIACAYGGYNLGITMGTLALTPTVFKPRPVADGEVIPLEVLQACAGPDAGWVNLSHQSSFHPNPKSKIDRYEWDMNAADGYWWDGDGALDNVSTPRIYFNDNGEPLNGTNRTLRYRYNTPGTFTITLRVVDEDGETNTKVFTVNVLPMQPSSPTSSPRGPYITDANISAGQGTLSLNGRVDDLNVNCGDQLTVEWDIDGRGQPVPQLLRNRIQNLNAAVGTLSQQDLQGLTLGHAYGLILSVTDSTGRSASSETELTVYPNEPIATWRATPALARCGQTVRFDATESLHPFPVRQITEYKWDLDGVDGFERQGEASVVEYTYNRFGTYTARLQVCDNVPFCDEGGEIEINVNQGNQSPVARLPFADVIHLTEDDLVINAGASFEPDVHCGDRIISYKWFFNPSNNNSAPNYVEDDPELNLTWNQLQTVLQGPADPLTGLPTNRIVLEVEDTLGLTHRAEMNLTLYKREPIAIFEQLPSPAPINEETGEVAVELDARESFSPRPGGQVVNYAWDLNNDGAFDEFIGQSVVTVRKIFEPVPTPDQIPSPIIALKVTDDRGEVGEFSLSLSYGLGDVPPTADADPSDAPELGYHILLGDSLFLNGAQTLEPNQGDWVRYYRWWLNLEPNGDQTDWQIESEDLDGDGQEAIYEVDPAVLAQYGVDTVGEYSIYFMSEDTSFLSSTDDSTLTVHAANPISVINIPRTQVSCGEQFTLDGSGSNHAHPDIQIVKYEWDLDGDNQYGTVGDREGAQVLFTANQFSFNGPQVIKLRVTDSRGNQSEEQVTISVDQGNSAPIANVGGPYAIAINDASFQLDASNSVDAEANCGDEINSYEWDLDGDGLYNNTAVERSLVNQAQPQVSRADFTSILDINDPLGNYEIGLRVTDKWGASQVSRGEIWVYNGPQAIASAEPPRAACDTDVSFNGLGSSTDGPLDKGFRIVSYAWDFDQDGEVDSTDALTIFRVGLGGADVAATLTITDESGRTDTDQVVFEINQDNNVSPVANAGGPYATGPINANQMTPINLDARASFDPDEPCDVITVYNWDTDGDGLYGADDTNGAGNRQGSDYSGAYIQDFTDPTWEVGLTKLVRVRVCDSKGSCSVPAVQEVEVRPTPPPTGEILSPRSDECLTSQDEFDIRMRYRDPDGGTVRMKVLIDDIEVHRENFDADPNGNYLEGTMTVDVEGLADGIHTLEVEIGDFSGAKTVVTPGGVLTFDRVAPSISFNDALLAGACYGPNQAPNPEPTVSDDLDTTPSMIVRFIEDSCLKTINVTATDSCGNETVQERSYRVSGPVAITLDGPQEGQLVGGDSARFTWTAEGPEECISAVTAEVNSEGGRTWVYQEGTQIVDPGAATLTVSVRDCSNQTFLSQRSFKVNSQPISRPQPPGHPNSVPLTAIPTYQIDEGDPLLLEGSSSSPPEENDEIVAYRWDFDNDGVVDALGEVVNADTSEDGSLQGQLTVEDLFGSTHTQDYEVLINDVNPLAIVGGPYQGLQGQDISFDGSNSRPDNPADPLSTDPQRPAVTWDWGDGLSNSGTFADMAQTEHNYAHDGLYQVRLTIRDEDSETISTARVSVGDVRPEIQTVTLPEGAYELQDLQFIVEATELAAEDRIIAYEWDFLGDGEFEAFPTSIATYRYLEAGSYQLTLRVKDQDSMTEQQFELEVRPVTLADLLREIDDDISELLAQIDLSTPIKNALAPTGQVASQEWANRGLWSEARRDEALTGNIDPEALALVAEIDGASDMNERMATLYRGNTLLALDELLFRLNRAQIAGARFGALMWKLSRQILRETEQVHASATLSAEIAFANNNTTFAADEDDRLINAQELLSFSRQLYENVDYFDRVTTRDGYLVRDLHSALIEAHFLSRDVTDIAHQADEFTLSVGGDPVAKVAEGNIINQDLIRSINQLYAELSAYSNSPVGQGLDQSPGLEAVNRAITSVEQIMDWVIQPIGIRCFQADPDHPDCQFINDQDSLSLQLALMDLIGDLFAAADAGVYVRNAQQMLTLAVKFRVEVALLRVESLCGANNPYPLSARAQQSVLLNLLNDGQRDAALLYYIAPERRCLVYEQYNECVIPALNQQRVEGEAEREGVEYPQVCEGIELIGGEEVGEGPDLSMPIPPREPFDDLQMLFAITTAYTMDWDIADPAIRNQHFPDLDWGDFNRDSRDENFNISDVNIALMQFNHDQIDYDEDGLMGLYEIDCQVMFGMTLSLVSNSTQNGLDAAQDCDGDGMPNLAEVESGLNPVEHRDADLDMDGDGMSNVQEWTWSQQGLGLDMRDPSDAMNDQDGDGVANWLEVAGGLDPLNNADAAGDFDQDGLSNGVELNNGLDPRDATDADTDPDGDGLSSREEINRGRNPLVADCESDLAELASRDDDPERARELLGSQDGLICSAVGAEDVDWYTFTIERDNQRFTARLLTDAPNMTLSLYQAIDGAQVESSRGRYEDSLIALPRGQLSPGEYWLKVSHRERDRAPETSYTLEYTLINPEPPCMPDEWEGNNGNNQRSLATILGLEEIRFGNGWICQDERNVGDWYTITLDGTDKTVHISFQPSSDGQLELAVMDQELTRYTESASLQKSAQCVNIKANGQAGLLYLRVTAATIYADGDDRVDYTLQVLDTDLNATPRGECDTLNNGLFDFHDWPTLEY